MDFFVVLTRKNRCLKNSHNDLLLPCVLPDTTTLRHGSFSGFGHRRRGILIGNSDIARHFEGYAPAVNKFLTNLSVLSLYVHYLNAVYTERDCLDDCLRG